eukprot:287997_1
MSAFLYRFIVYASLFDSSRAWLIEIDISQYGPEQFDFALPTTHDYRGIIFGIIDFRFINGICLNASYTFIPELINANPSDWLSTRWPCDPSCSDRSTNCDCNGALSTRGVSYNTKHCNDNQTSTCDLYSNCVDHATLDQHYFTDDTVRILSVGKGWNQCDGLTWNASFIISCEDSYVNNITNIIPAKGNDETKDDIIPKKESKQNVKVNDTTWAILIVLIIASLLLVGVMCFYSKKMQKDGYQKANEDDDGDVTNPKEPRMEVEMIGITNTAE